MATFVCADMILGATTVRQITSSSHSSGLQARKSMNSGGDTVQQISGLLAEEITTFSSADVGVLCALGTNTFCSVGLFLTASTITVPYKSRSTGGSFASGANHSALSGASALIIPTQIEASQDADAGASLTGEIHWLSADGLAAGATGSTGNSLGAQSFSAEFALGPAFINTVEVPGVQSIRVNPGITLVKSSAKGLVRPTKISIQTVMPTMEITTDDIDGLVARLNAFTAMTSANIYLRKRVDSGVYSATTDNVRFTFAAGLIFDDSVDVNDVGNGTGTVTLHGKTLTTTSAVAIP
jgi:hypothetical protein